MKGYWVIIGTDVTDQNAQAEYGRLWKPIAEKYQAVINPSDTPPALKESRMQPDCLSWNFHLMSWQRHVMKTLPIRKHVSMPSKLLKESC